KASISGSAPVASAPSNAACAALTSPRSKAPARVAAPTASNTRSSTAATTSSSTSRRCRRGSAPSPPRSKGSSPHTSPPLPLRIALLEERGDPLDQVLGREGERELGAQELERVLEGHVLLAVHGVVAKPHQYWAFRGELGRPVGDGGVELGGRNDPVG